MDKYLSLSVIFSLSLVSLVMSFQANEYQQILFGLSPFHNLISNVNNITSFLVPIVQFIFIVCTTKIMLLLFDENANILDVSIYVGYGFSFILLSVLFFAINFIAYDYKIVTLENLDSIFNITFLFGLKFVHFERIILVAWCFMYISSAILLFYKMKLKLFPAFVSIVTPTLIVMLMGEVIK